MDAEETERKEMIPPPVNGLGESSRRVSVFTVGWLFKRGNLEKSTGGDILK